MIYVRLTLMKRLYLELHNITEGYYQERVCRYFARKIGDVVGKAFSDGMNLKEN